MPSSEVNADPRAVLKMPERSWPVDLLGNEIRRGQLVSFRIPEQLLVCRVVEVIQAGIMHDPENKPIALQGAIKLGLDVGYKHGVPLTQILALKEPEK